MTTYAMKIASAIVTAHLATNKMPGGDIPALLESIFGKVVELDETTMEVMPSARADAPRDTARHSDGVSSRAVATSIAHASPSTFDADRWIESLPEANSFTESEARRDNPYLNQGWVGVHFSHIVCLLDGKSVRVLTSHLKRHYKNDPRASSAEAYRAHFRLPPDYPMGAPEFHALKSKVISDSHARGRRSRDDREAEVATKVNAAIVKAGLDPRDQISPDTTPGVFADTIVCIACSAKVDNIIDHMREDHPRMSMTKYLTSIKAVGEYPAQPPKSLEPAFTYEDTLDEAAKLMNDNDRSADRQVNGQEWPGVFERFITCLEDGKEVENLSQHLKANYNMSEDDYLDKWLLPDNYPFVAPSMAANVVAPAPVSTSAAAASPQIPDIAMAVAKKVKARKSGRIGLFGKD